MHQKPRSRNFDARNEKIETGAVVKSHRGLSGVERGKGICYQWKAKGQCSRGDQCCFPHESDDRAKLTPKGAPRFEPPTPSGRGASRRRSLRGRSQSGKFNRQRCKNFLKGTCTKLPCDFWHPPGCQFFLNEIRVVNSAQSAHFRTGRLTYHRTLSRQNLYRFLGRAQKFWDQFDDYDSQELRCVRQTSENEKKIHR